jgi:hypothetical protein
MKPSVHAWKKKPCVTETFAQGTGITEGMYESKWAGGFKLGTEGIFFGLFNALDISPLNRMIS